MACVKRVKCSGKKTCKTDFDHVVKLGFIKFWLSIFDDHFSSFASAHMTSENVVLIPIKSCLQFPLINKHFNHFYSMSRLSNN